MKAAAILIILCMLTAALLPMWPWSRHWGFGGASLAALTLLVAVVLALVGRLEDDGFPPEPSRWRWTQPVEKMTEIQITRLLAEHVMGWVLIQEQQDRPENDDRIGYYSPNGQFVCGFNEFSPTGLWIDAMSVLEVARKRGIMDKRQTMSTSTPLELCQIILKEVERDETEKEAT